MNRTDNKRRVMYLIGAVVLLAIVASLAFWRAGNAVALIIILAFVGLIAFIIYRSDHERPVEPITGDDSSPGDPGLSRTEFIEQGGGGGRLLIVAGAATSEVDDLPPDARKLIDAADEIRVIAPSLPTRFDWLASATDNAQEQADERLHTVLGQLDDLGADPSGTVGADDRLLAFEDAIRDFSPDHLLVALRGGGKADWQEQGLLDSLDERFGIPKTVFELSDSRSQSDME